MGRYVTNGLNGPGIIYKSPNTKALPLQYTRKPKRIYEVSMYDLQYMATVQSNSPVISSAIEHFIGVTLSPLHPPTFYMNTPDNEIPFNDKWWFIYNKYWVPFLVQVARWLRVCRCLPYRVIAVEEFDETHLVPQWVGFDECQWYVEIDPLNPEYCELYYQADESWMMNVKSNMNEIPYDPTVFRSYSI